MIGEYSLNGICQGKTRDWYGFQTRIMTITGYQINHASDFINAKIVLSQRLEGDAPVYEREISDPSMNQSGIRGIFGSFNYGFAYTYFQTNATVGSGDRYRFTSPTWIFDYSTAPFPDRRGEFNPLSVVTVTRPDPKEIPEYRVFTINSSATFREKSGTGTSNISDTLPIFFKSQSQNKSISFFPA